MPADFYRRGQKNCIDFSVFFVLSAGKIKKGIDKVFGMWYTFGVIKKNVLRSHPAVFCGRG